MRLVLILVVVLALGWWMFHRRPAPTSITWNAPLIAGDLMDRHGQSVPRTGSSTKPYTFIYFSAGWCPPCHAFTPRLVEFYQAAGNARNFDVVMVSLDREPQDLIAYADEFKMPWALARLNSPLAGRLRQAYAGEGIPDLVLIDRTGAVLADSFSGSTYLGPEHVLEEYRKRLGPR